MTKIKPCPFCGNKARVIKDGPSAQVRCRECGVSTPWFYEIERIDAPGFAVTLAVDTWNMRQPAAPEPGDNVALKRLILEWLKQDDGYDEQVWPLIREWVNKEVGE